MNPMIFPRFAAHLSASILLSVLPVGALTPGEQADDFFARGVAAEQRGDSRVARNCFQLALRADPNHQKTLAKLGPLAEKKADEHVTRGVAAEAKGDFAVANVQYALALDAVPSHAEAGKRMAELKKRMGAGFRSGKEVVIQEKLRSIVIPEIAFHNTTLGEAAATLWLRSIELDTTEPHQELAGTPIMIGKVSAETGSVDIASLRINNLRQRDVPLERALQAICDVTKTSYLIGEDGIISILRVEAPPPPAPPAVPNNPPLPGTTAGAPAPQPPPAPSGPLVWKSKDGRSVDGDFVGLDGEAVVIKRDGKEITISFTRLDAASVEQAKALAKRVAPMDPEDPFAVPTPSTPPQEPVAPSVAAVPAPKHRWSFGGDLRDSLGGAHGTLVDPGEPTARFTDGKLDLSANRGDPSRNPTNDAYVDLPNGLVKGAGGKLTFEAWVQPTKNLVRACIFRFEVATVEGLGAHSLEANAKPSDDYQAIFLIARDEDGDLIARAAKANRLQEADSGADLVGEGERHFALTLDPGDRSAGPNGTMRLYLDGKQVATGRMFQNFLATFNDNNCWLGRTYAGNPFFSGIYNEFRIYDKALTPEEVLASFRAGPDAVIPPAGSGARE
jgi:tetratricopeptide (TPR) repeat protein